MQGGDCGSQNSRRPSRPGPGLSRRSAALCRGVDRARGDVHSHRGLCREVGSQAALKRHPAAVLRVLCSTRSQPASFGAARTCIISYTIQRNNRDCLTLERRGLSKLVFQSRQSRYRPAWTGAGRHDETACACNWPLDAQKRHCRAPSQPCPLPGGACAALAPPPCRCTSLRCRHTCSIALCRIGCNQAPAEPSGVAGKAAALERI